MLELPLHFIYPIYTVLLALIMFAVVPKEKIKSLSFYGIIFGAMANVVIILIKVKVLQVGGHINYGFFGAYGIPFFPPIAWSAFFIMYLYLLPDKKPWYYIFTLSSIIYSTIFASVLMNLDIFKINYGRDIVPFITYLVWHSAVTWVYLSYFKNKSIYS